MSAGIGHDQTTGYDNQTVGATAIGTVSNSLSAYSIFAGNLGAGFHVISANEGGDGTNANTFNVSQNATLTIMVRN